MGANAQTSVPLFVANSVLTAAQQNISAATGVPVFATTVTRDAAFGGSNKALAEGQLAYIEASNVVQYYDGAAWATVGPAAGAGLTLINLTTVTAAATTTISNVFTSTYTDYRIVLTLRGVTNANKLRAQMCVSGTPVTSGYSAGCFIGQYTLGAPTNLNQGYVETTAFSLGYIPNTSYDANVSFDLFNPQQALNTGQAGLSASVNSGSNDTGGIIMGFLATATQYDGIKILNSAGTNMTGTVAIYGYAKA